MNTSPSDSPYLAAVSDVAAATTPTPTHSAAPRSGSLRSFVSRHPVGSFLIVAYLIFWTSWMPVLFLGAAPRLDLRRQTLRRGLASVRQASRRLTS